MNQYIKNNKISLLSMVVTVSLFIASPVFARPVSYPGGWTMMTMNDSDHNSLHIHYSPTKNYSVGYRTAYWSGLEYQTHSLQVNNLLKRWNKLESQANWYLKSGVGIAYDSGGQLSDDIEPHAFTGMSLDWENRRFFTGYSNHYHYVKDIDDSQFEQSVMLGITPYIGEYGDLHTWLMVKIEHEPEERDHFTITPHVRFFKGVYLFEIGFSENKDLMANLVIRF